MSRQTSVASNVVVIRRSRRFAATPALGRRRPLTSSALLGLWHFQFSFSIRSAEACAFAAAGLSISFIVRHSFPFVLVCAAAPAPGRLGSVLHFSSFSRCPSRRPLRPSSWRVSVAKKPLVLMLIPTSAIPTTAAPLPMLRAAVPLTVAPWSVLMRLIF